MVRIVIVAVEGCLASAVLGAVDAFRLATLALNRAGETVAPFEVQTASIGGTSVVDGHGRTVAIDADLASLKSCAAFLVPGFVPGSGGLPPDMTQHSAVLHWIRDQHGRGSLACASCSGTFLLGHAGLLDGRRCTTTWWLQDAFRQRFPRADTAFGAVMVADGRVITAGGPFSWIELVLQLLERLLGPEAARRAADFAVIDAAPTSQAVYIPIGQSQGQSAFLMEAERLVRQHPASLTSVGLARRLGVSERTLNRRLSAASGETPRALLERVRFDGARSALETGTRPIKQIADACGYSDEASFRRAFRRVFGKSPSEYRRWKLQRQGG